MAWYTDMSSTSEVKGLMAQNEQTNLARARSMGNGPADNVTGTMNASPGTANVRLTGDSCASIVMDLLPLVAEVGNPAAKEAATHVTITREVGTREHSRNLIGRPIWPDRWRRDALGCNTASAKSLAIIPGQPRTGAFHGRKADGVPAGV